MASYFNQQQHPIKIVSIPIAQNTRSLIKGAVGCATNAPNDFAAYLAVAIYHHYLWCY